MRLSKEERECFTWYLKNKDNGIASHLFNMAQMLQCPCDSGLLRFDPRFTFSRIDYRYKVMCYATMTIGRNAVRSMDSVLKSFVSFLSIVLSWKKTTSFSLPLDTHRNVVIHLSWPRGRGGGGGDQPLGLVGDLLLPPEQYWNTTHFFSPSIVIIMTSDPKKSAAILVIAIGFTRFVQ